jgi:hypothetical protein
MLRVSWVWSQTQETECNAVLFNCTNTPQGAHNTDGPKHREWKLYNWKMHDQEHTRSSTTEPKVTIINLAEQTDGPAV